MKILRTFILLFLFSQGLFAQLNVHVEINTHADIHPISKFIYGSNGQSSDEDENITARRLGGNRLTGYNWETNASNAGEDYFNQSDDYLPWISGIPQADYGIPNVVLQNFHDTSLAMSCYSLITLPMAGYVAADENGTVDVTETAPSARFYSVVNKKTGAFALQPDLTDNIIYVDECVNSLVQQNGLANTANGIKGYSMDNEYALWNSTHPRIHPLQPTIAEVISKSVSLAWAIKNVDGHAEVFGPADYGYASFRNFQASPDWNNYSINGNFINAYLGGMKNASDSLHRRLLDVVDVHWYPEARGYNHQGVQERVVGGSNDRAVAEARMQCPRTLWDSSYVEDSWIGQYFSPCVYIPTLLNGINIYNPGTKLAFTEFNYGGEDHISGGIAIADVLGIFGRTGVYMGNYWGAIEDYISAAYKIYRNYDGNNSTFGDVSVLTTTDNILNTSVYASVESSDSSRIHMIVMNKNYDTTITAQIAINPATHVNYGEVYSFSSSSGTISHLSPVTSVPGNILTYVLDPLTVYHFIFSDNTTTAVHEINADKISVSPNPSSSEIAIRNIPFSISSLSLMDMNGKEILKENVTSSFLLLDVSRFSKGVYTLIIRDETNTFSPVIKKIIVQ